MTKLVHLLIVGSSPIAEYCVDALRPVASILRRSEAGPIPGWLHHENGGFAQCIEGGERHIRDLVRRLRADGRHADMLAIAQARVARSRFEDFQVS